LALIICSSLLGAIIPQQRETAEYAYRYGMTAGTIVRSLHLFDVFHSLWFVVLLFLFVLNLSVCTVRRAVQRHISAGSLVTHGSIVVILLWAMISALYCERGVLYLAKGHATDAMIISTGVKQLGFIVFLEDFTVVQARKDARQGVTDFRSIVRIIVQEREVLRAGIGVNSPLRYIGYSLYQSYYDPVNAAWTGIEVVRDPGVPVLYAGFVLLNIGIMLILIPKFLGGLSHDLH
jgi:cytochrome c biogenesis protein ResB